MSPASYRAAPPRVGRSDFSGPGLLGQTGFPARSGLRPGRSGDGQQIAGGTGGAGAGRPDRAQSPGEVEATDLDGAQLPAGQLGGDGQRTEHGGSRAGPYGALDGGGGG